MVLISQELFKVKKKKIIQWSQEIESYNHRNKGLEYLGHQRFHLYSTFDLGGH